ncbi:hypothetical protein GQ600_10225 [Phytophthora cactorum]|nr:hypothetical protein GQ600_10225 [Phytophthora cactorum]
MYTVQDHQFGDQRVEAGAFMMIGGVEFEQRRRYGLDCGDVISFEAGSWAPGGEHVRQLTVRNVSQRTIKFKYELPRTKYFSMHFPTVMTLSPGMLTTLDVAFRPVKLEEYDDFVGFHVHLIEGGVAAVSGRFRMPVVARIAALKVEIPHGVDFGFCPTKETTLQSFMLHNCGQIDALFDWTVPAAGDHGRPFAVRPEFGRVKAGTSIELTASFCPSSASVYVTTTTCTVKSFAPAHALVETMKISGISKFTHLSASETELNFGEVLVGAPNTSRAPTEKEFILRNRSLVRASFSIENVESDHDPRFFFSPLSGVVEAESTVSIKVRYTPLSAGTFTCDHFDILTPGGNRVRITCKGELLAHIDAYRLRAAAGLGRLSPDQLETYREENGDTMFLKGALELAKVEESLSTNDTDSSVSLLPPPSRILTRSGEASLADVEVCSEYFISIEDKANPMVVLGAFLDFGGCGIVQFPSKKLLLVTNNTHSKVTCSWRVAVAPGPSEMSDDQSVFQVYPPSSDIAAGATAEFRVAFQPTRINTYYFAELEAFASFKSNRTFRLVNVDAFTPPWCLVVKTCGNTFASPTEQFLPKISFQVMKNKVNFPPCYLGDSVFQTVMIENASDTPAVFAFVEDPAEVFSCKPMYGYIEAKSFHLVAIRFTPRNVRKYSCFLQCIVNNARAKPEVLELSAICALPQLSFQDIEAGQLLSSEAKVHIKPTSVGLQSLRHIELINTSRVPLVYRWELPPKYQNVFRVKPKLGRLNGRESTSIECSFTPDEIREYASRFIVAVKSISVPLDQRKSLKSKIPVLQELTVRVQTKGTTGAILFQPETLKFETILVNSSSKQTFFIENTADCDLMYSLQQSMVAKTKTSRQNEENDANINEEDGIATAPAGKLVFSQAEGCIPAQSRKKITATFFPTSAGLFTFEVSCVVGNQEASSPYDTWGFHELKPATCIIQAEASFPTIEIQDLRVPGLSTQLAWHQFRCNEINKYLAAPLIKEEDKLTRSTTAIGDSSSPESDDLGEENMMKRFALPFSPAPLESRTERVFLKLRNPGNLVVQYHLRLPKEGTVEIEHWAETGAPSAEEVRLNSIIDSKVFSISPRRATLLPHQSILLTLSYSYTSEALDGEHNLPLFLEVEKGKKVVLELQGRTLKHKDPKLFLPSQVFHLSPVTIGEFRRGFLPPPALARHVVSSSGDGDDFSDRHEQSRVGRPPVQQIEVFNRGDSALRLDIGSVSFKQVNAANYGYQGTIEVPLLLKAHGLMGKGYKEMVEITVVATGYHPKQWTLQQMKNDLWLSTAPPKKQALSIPDLPACFVSDYMDFGHVAMHSEANQLLVLQNENAGDSDESPRSFVFEWDSMHPLVANGTISFSPKRGELGPGEKKLIRVSVVAGGDAFVVNHDVACTITYSDEHTDTISNNAASGSPSRSRSQTTTSASGRGNDRMSIIHRSTATQEAVVDKRGQSGTKLAPLSSNDTPHTQTPLSIAQRSSHSSSRKALTQSQSTRKGSPERTGMMSSSDSRHLDALAATESTPLFVRIYAHVLPLDVVERIYPREELKKMPLPTTKQISRVLPVPAPTVRDVKTPSLSSSRDTSTSTRTSRELNSRGRMGSDKLSTSKPGTAITTVIENESAAATCRDVLYDVMETLVMDVLTSSVIQGALEEQLVPLPRSDRALEHASTSEGAKAIHSPEALYHEVRQNDDCQAIVAGVMENTVFNVLQELFYGDLEQELLCVPRKTVFPNAASSPVASHQPAIGTSVNKNSQSLLKTLLLLLVVEILGEGLCHDKWEHQCGVSVDFDWLGAKTQLAPRHGLVGAGTSVATVELLACVDEHGVVGTVAHEVGVQDVVLDHSATENNRAGLARSTDRVVVHTTNIASNIYHKSLVTVRVEVDHVANGSVRERRAEDGDVVLVAPVRLAQATGDEVGRVAQEDLGLDGLAELGSLRSSSCSSGDTGSSLRRHLRMRLISSMASPRKQAKLRDSQLWSSARRRLARCLIAAQEPTAPGADIDTSGQPASCHAGRVVPAYVAPPRAYERESVSYNDADGVVSTRYQRVWGPQWSSLPLPSGWGRRADEYAEFAPGIGSITCVRWWRSLNGKNYCLVGGTESLISIVNVEENAEECRCELVNAGTIVSIDLLQENFRKERRTSMLVKAKTEDIDDKEREAGGTGARYYRVVLEKKFQAKSKVSPKKGKAKQEENESTEGATSTLKIATTTGGSSSSSETNFTTTNTSGGSSPFSFSKAPKFVVKTFPQHFLQDLDFRPQRIKKNSPQVCCTLSTVLKGEYEVPDLLPASFADTEEQSEVESSGSNDQQGETEGSSSGEEKDEVVDVDLTYCSTDLMLLQGRTSKSNETISTWVSLPSNQGMDEDIVRAHIVHYLSLHGNERIERVVQSTARSRTSSGASGNVGGSQSGEAEIIYILQTKHNVYECRPQWSRLALFKALCARTIALRDALSIGYALGIDMASLCQVVANTLYTSVIDGRQPQIPSLFNGYASSLRSPELCRPVL